MMNKTEYSAPAVIVIRIEPARILTGSNLTVGYSDETTDADANARGYGFVDDFDEDDQDESSSRSGKSSYVW